jgi:hypothetical protein
MRSPGVADARDDSDAASVLCQLRDAIAVRVRASREPHPFGSTLAIEALYDVELFDPSVVIAVDTDTIPVDVTTLCLRNDVAFRVRFFNPRVECGQATYQAELVSRSKVP